ncbi:restriction endonuclease subunit S [Staphylococcus ursi]|uniref:restriction endonuclease subunit S n=1 Tax=Staphylococcus sp. MI 10-1553 TaxID=1912064 RepID=UPI0013985C05|nr:restriction endonuclease subunit S [Staphylococcus sp. MI 10-1553]QHW38189.1 restriction endonuclease subunit S [Staphylococcus sp. MI 10-1553]
MTHPNKNVPELRFPEFSDEWEERKISDFLTESMIEGNKGNDAKKLTVKLWGKGVIPKKKVHKGSSNTQYYLRKKGQLMYGKLDFLNCAFGIVPPHLDGYESTIDSPAFDFINGDPRFVLERIMQKSFYKKYGEKANGSRKAKRINQKDFLEMLLYSPAIKEQQRIGDFFSKLDRQIELEEQKLALLEEQKKGYMQKIFSQELRFKDDNGENYPEWEENLFRDFTTTFSGGTPKSTNKSFYNGSIPFIRSGEIQGSKTELQINEDAISNSSAKLVNKGDLLYALYGATSGEVAISKITGAINQAILCIKTEESKSFLLYYLKYQKENIINTYIQGGQGNLSASIIKNLSIKMPIYKEQQKIGDFFSKLDHQIELQAQKINLFNQRKQGLLQKMFV